MECKKAALFLGVSPLALLFPLLSEPAVIGASDSSQDKLRALSHIVVSVTSIFQNGSEQHGLGVAIGHSSMGTLFVTTNSLVRSEDPDNQIKEVLITEPGDTSQTHQALLLETSDRRMNIALITAETKTDLLRELEYKIPPNRSFVGLEIMGCVWNVKPTAKLWVIGPAGGSGAPYIEGRVISGFVEGRARAAFAALSEVWIGAPAVVNGGIVGFLERVEAHAASIVSIEKVHEAVERWNLNWHFKPSQMVCVEPSDPINTLRQDPDRLPELVFLLFQPGASYQDIFEVLRPTDYDLRQIFEASQLAGITLRIAELFKEMGGHRVKYEPENRADYVETEDCVRLPLGHSDSWKGFTVKINSRVIYCNAEVWTSYRNYFDTTNFKGFWFVNGHWIWIPL